MDRERTAPLPTRRRLLKGAALATVPYTLLSGTRAAAQARAADNPSAAIRTRLRAAQP